MAAPREDARLLGPSDPQPVEWVNPDSSSDVLLICEHAGRTVPAALHGLGIASEALDTHIGWDIGAESVARLVAARLNAPLVMQRYSRLVIDCNRPPGSAESIPDIVHGVPIPANQNATLAERKCREDEIFAPLDTAYRTALTDHPRRAAFSIHSFNTEISGQRRPWNVGFLTRKDKPTGNALIEAMQAAHPDLVLALNEPYQIDDDTDWFVPAHAEPNGLCHSLVEIRNDQLRDDTGVAFWAEALSAAITSFMEARR